MIAYIKGQVIKRSSNNIIVLAGNIGYRIFVSPDTISKLKNECELFTYHRITDQDQALFGFTEDYELEFFEKLISVNGVGPKTALAIISHAPIETLKSSISSNNPTFFSKIAGVGKKTAERIVLELKNKLSSSDIVDNSGYSEVHDALTALGYTSKEIKVALERINLNQDTAKLIKDALKIIGK